MNDEETVDQCTPMCDAPKQCCENPEWEAVWQTRWAFNNAAEIAERAANIRKAHPGLYLAALKAAVAASVEMTHALEAAVAHARNRM